MYRQGDVLIVPIAEDAVPPAVRAETGGGRDGRGRMVLALGEVTGHAHAILAPGRLIPDGSNAWLHLPEGGRLAHEEHAAISLPAGWFRVVRQREYIPGAIRVVAD